MTSPNDPPPTRRPVAREPGLILAGVLVAYAAVVFAWWPSDIVIGGLSLVAWLMIVGLVLWVALGFIYCFWVERLERQEGGQR